MAHTTEELVSLTMPSVFVPIWIMKASVTKFLEVVRIQTHLDSVNTGFAMVALLVSLSVMGLMTSIMLPVWSHAAKREREAELIFRGEQYRRAIELYQRKVAGAFPPDLETLVGQRFLRKLYTDPMAEDGVFHVIYQNQDTQAEDNPVTSGTLGNRVNRFNQTDQSGNTLRSAFGQAMNTAANAPDGIRGGIIGVVSKSTEMSIRLYNGFNRYNEWAFIHAAPPVPSSMVPTSNQGNVTGF